MDVGDVNGNGRYVGGLENCTCPAGYSGTSCETCDYGYVKQIDPFTANAVCKKCNCHNHSPECDQMSNHCSVIITLTDIRFVRWPVSGSPFICYYDIVSTLRTYIVV